MSDGWPEGKRDLDERLLAFAAQVVTLAEMLHRTAAGKNIAMQVIRSATSVGANYEEAQAAESKRDFTHKLQLSLKEMRETDYWLRLIEKTSLIDAGKLAPLVDESRQLRAILSKCVVTAKRKPQEQEASR